MARWGVALAAVATLILIIQPFVSYLFLIVSHDPSPGYGAIGAMLFISRALSVLSSLLLFLLSGLTSLQILGYFGQGWIPLVPAVVLVILRGPCWMLLEGLLWLRAPGRTDAVHPHP